MSIKGVHRPLLKVGLPRFHERQGPEDLLDELVDLREEVLNVDVLRGSLEKRSGGGLCINTGDLVIVVELGGGLESLSMRELIV